MKKQYKYVLPVGLAPSKVEGCREELEAALGGVCEFESNGRVVTITLFQNKLEKEYRYQCPEVSKGLTVPIGYSIEGELITLNMASDSHCFLLAGGNPGTGKSVFLNGCVDCLSHYEPEYLKMIFIDMKMGCELGSW